MSALSEIDLRDFQKIDVDLLEAQLAEDDTHTIVLFDFKEYCDTLRRLQKKLIPQTPALFKGTVCQSNLV
jgi:hypothetical protein